MNRWWVVLGAVLIQLCLGAIYAWSVFTPSLVIAPYFFSKSDTQWIFGVGLITFALVMILSGRLQANFTPRQLVVAGGLILGSGYLLVRFVGTSFIGHVFCLGVIGGSGIGLAYAIPIAVGVRWFPDRKGLLTGLAVAGFGFGALLWIRLADSWLHLIETIGVANVFTVYGLVFMAIIMIGSIWMVNPPTGFVPSGSKLSDMGPAQSGGLTGAAGSDSKNLSALQMLHTPQFYSLWLMFLAGSMAGLMVIGGIKLFGIDALKSIGMEDEDASLRAGTAMAVFFALANGLGRIVWGMISDRIGRRMSLFLMFLAQGLVLLFFYRMAFHVGSLYLGAALIGFNFGGNFALFPAATADYFGNKTVGANYGWIFSAYGVGGIVGPLLGGYFGDVAQLSGNVDSWAIPFMVAGVSCLLAAGLALTLRRKP